MSILKGKTKLNEFMQFDHVICVKEDGTIHDDTREIYAPNVCVNLDADGQIVGDAEAEMIADVAREGWTLLTGWTGQYLAGNGPIMHNSEFVGGGLEAHIRETPGFYACVVVECNQDEWENESEGPEPAGWAIAYMSLEKAQEREEKARRDNIQRANDEDMGRVSFADY